MFVIGTLLPINMGALAFVAAWLVGMYSLNLDEKEIIAGISGDLVLTLVGVTYLFAIAKNNGTVDVIVRSAVRAVGGRVVLIPWVMFGVTAVLTDRETEVLRFVSTGQSARAIADRLGVSHRTVQNHVQNTLRKLQLHNRVELTRWAIEQGLTE